MTHLAARIFQAELAACSRSRCMCRDHSEMVLEPGSLGPCMGVKSPGWVRNYVSSACLIVTTRRVLRKKCVVTTIALAVSGGLHSALHGGGMAGWRRRQQGSFWRQVEYIKKNASSPVGMIACRCSSVGNKSGLDRRLGLFQGKSANGLATTG